MGIISRTRPGFRAQLRRKSLEPPMSQNGMDRPCSRRGAVWASLTLCVCYSLEDYLPRYRTEAAAITQAMPMGVSRQAAVYAGASVTAQRPI
jgi:hypothetical protein